MNRSEQIERLRAIPLFSEFNRRELSLILDLSVSRIFGPGTDIVTEGEAGREMYVLQEGEAEVIRGRKKIARLRPGDYFGETALLMRRPRNATVRAATAVKVLVVRRYSFQGLTEKIPDFHRKLLDAACARLVDIDPSILA